MQHRISKAIIVSDLHIGLPQFHRVEFQKLVEPLSADISLILNGDTLDNPQGQLSPADRDVIDFIRDQSYRRTVIWLHGNHDGGYRIDRSGRIHFQRQLLIKDRLLVVHGDGFERVKTRHRWFVRQFLRLHRLHKKLGASPVHVAEFARHRYPWLYRVLTNEVRKNAVKWAIRHNVATVTCGHTHFPEDSVRDGVRYINTGSWTQSPLCHVAVTEHSIELIRTARSG